jgi:hypothetical protein
VVTARAALACSGLTLASYGKATRKAFEAARPGGLTLVPNANAG